MSSTDLGQTEPAESLTSTPVPVLPFYANKPLVSPSINQSNPEVNPRAGAPLADEVGLLKGRTEMELQIALETVESENGLNGTFGEDKKDPMEVAGAEMASVNGVDNRIGGEHRSIITPAGSVTGLTVPQPRRFQSNQSSYLTSQNGIGSGGESSADEEDRQGSGKGFERRQKKRREKLLVKGLLDAPARAALNLPNESTYHQQALAFRNSQPFANTPTFEISPSAAFQVVQSVKGKGSGVNGISNGVGNAGGDKKLNADEEGDVGNGDGDGYSSSVGVGIGGGLIGIGGGRNLSGPGDYFAGSGIGGSSSRSGTSRPKSLDLSNDESRASSRSPSPTPLFGGLGSRSNLLKRIRIDRAGSPNQHLLRPTFPPPSLSTYSPQPPRPLSAIEKINLFFLQTASLLVSTTFLIGVVTWALGSEVIIQIPRILKGKKKKKVFPWDDEKYWKKEKVSKEPRDYARNVGMDIEDQTVETEDGYFLRVNKVIDPEARKKSDGRGGFPVLILHGLFQSSGSFITSEDRSMAFWLSKQAGYQVYLGNTRGVFGMGHRNFSTHDPRFWDWTIRELAMYDLPALVEHVCAETGYDKIGFIGHSQGNGLAFISLSLGMCPSLGKKLSIFVALAPAVYAGPLTSGFPFTQLGKIEWTTWKRIFGVLDFIPLMRWSYDYCPPKIFATLGYIMFAYLFSWTDTNWLHRRKTKMFRFTPTPVSSASVFWWCGKGGFAARKCTMDDTLERWYDHRFPPISIFYGGRDFLVLVDPLIERLKNKEKDVQIIRVEKTEHSEHCDTYWSSQAPEEVFYSLRDDIEKTRPRYPEELEEQAEA